MRQELNICSWFMKPFVIPAAAVLSDVCAATDLLQYGNVIKLKVHQGVAATSRTFNHFTFLLLGNVKAKQVWLRMK